MVLSEADRGPQSPTSMTANLSEKPYSTKAISRKSSCSMLCLEDSFLNLAVSALDQYAVTSSRCLGSRKNSASAIIGMSFAVELSLLKQANTVFEVRTTIRSERACTVDTEMTSLFHIVIFLFNLYVGCNMPPKNQRDTKHNKIFGQNKVL